MSLETVTIKVDSSYMVETLDKFRLEIQMLVRDAARYQAARTLGIRTPMGNGRFQTLVGGSADEALDRLDLDLAGEDDDLAHHTL